MKKDGVRIPSRQDVMEKQEAIQKSRPLNIAAEKERLRREMEVAESKRYKAEVERIQAMLKELEAISKQKKELDTKEEKQGGELQNGI
ncbi:hypothetical protein IFM89_032800 [Coptis chinensis]|uniref:Uncharacterized protein n=1 Tax=Coptis chinensis TaxID=261450 RepID=A0A835LP59_9MAGN|nr:hypothetical protein IFM89_032800 [Coptis chinensis]